MDKVRARGIAREAIRGMQKFWDSVNALELEVLGGTLSIDYDRALQQTKNAVAKLENWEPPPVEIKSVMEDVIEGAAFGATEEEINDDAWIDEVIREIQEGLAGAAVDTDDGIIIYEPRE